MHESLETKRRLDISLKFLRSNHFYWNLAEIILRQFEYYDESISNLTLSICLLLRIMQKWMFWEK